MVTVGGIVYDWDEPKRLWTLQERRIDFSDAHLVYANPAKMTLTTVRQTEERQLDMAMVAVVGVVLVLIYTMRGEVVRVISMRKASRKERAIYEG